MGGADTWNEALQEFGDRKAMMKALSEDPYGIAYTSLPNSNQGVKPLALAEDAAQPYIALSRENVADRSYPLSRFAYLYFAPDTVTGDAARTDPKILEFIRFILSSQGRRAFEPEGDYSPLPVAVAVEQLKKLD
jgi:phosphate transport system substrate-binding protein